PLASRPYTLRRSSRRSPGRARPSRATRRAPRARPRWAPVPPPRRRAWLLSSGYGGWGAGCRRGRWGGAVAEPRRVGGSPRIVARHVRAGAVGDVSWASWSAFWSASSAAASWETIGSGAAPAAPAAPAAAGSPAPSAARWYWRT